VSPLIKSDAAVKAGVRRLSAARPAHHVAPSPAELEIASLRAQLESLSQQLQDGQAERRRLEDAAAQAFKEGETAGRQEADERRAAAMALLEDGIAKAASRFGDEMAGLEKLAVLVARESVGKVLGDPELHADHLARIIRIEVARLADGAVLHVAVARRDFPHEEDVARLAQLLDRPELKLRASDELKAGECEIKAMLGAIEVGVAQQWDRLSGLLGELAAPEAGS
jgi:flagellar biosynthesis/type III secretory pathway protein FliH